MFNVELFREAVADAGYATRSYSGRGMYGTQCLGVTIPSMSEFGGIVGAYVQARAGALQDDNDKIEYHEVIDIGEEIGYMFTCMSSDSMGQSIIVYWQGVKWNDAWKDEEEGEEDED